MTSAFYDFAVLEEENKKRIKITDQRSKLGCIFQKILNNKSHKISEMQQIYFSIYFTKSDRRSLF